MSKCFRIVVTIVTILAFLMTSLPALAGNGDGSGGGSDEPLLLLSANPANGQKNVPLKTEIILGFSKNVVHMTVKEGNSKCFALYGAGQKLIPIEVKMADDQIQPEIKREIIIHPKQALTAGTTYTLKISSKLKSKSEVSLEKDIVLTFSTIPAVKSATTNVIKPPVKVTGKTKVTPKSLKKPITPVKKKTKITPKKAISK